MKKLSRRNPNALIKRYKHLSKNLSSELSMSHKQAKWDKSFGLPKGFEYVIDSNGNFVIYDNKLVIKSGS